MKTVTKDALLGTRKITPVEIEELGTVYIKSFPASVGFGDFTNDLRTGQAYISALMDEKGERLFKDDEIADALENIDHRVIQQVIKAVNKVNGLEKPESDAEKN